ncbi:MAG: hypothetical protein Q4B89_05185 [Lachnospiraceae bacterium]|nr:hypothetical protein [Lachnospiraceae bacterium]
MKRKLTLCILVNFLFAIFITGCDVGKEKTNSYLNAEVLEVGENVLTVKPTDNKETKAPREVKEAEKLILDLNGFDIKVLPENLTAGEKIRINFNEDSIEKGNVPKIKIVFGIFRLDKDGEVITE